MAAGITGAKERWRNARRRMVRRLADRATRRRILLVLATLVAIGLLAAVKGIIGYYVFSSRSTRIEVALTVVAAVAGLFALGERKVARLSKHASTGTRSSTATRSPRFATSSPRSASVASSSDDS